MHADVVEAGGHCVPINRLNGESQRRQLGEFVSIGIEDMHLHSGCQQERIHQQGMVMACHRCIMAPSADFLLEDIEAHGPATRRFRFIA